MEETLILLLKYKYLILFPIAVVQGPIASVISGFLISRGDFSLLPAFFILILGDIIPDSVYFYVGRYGRKDSLVNRLSRKLSSLLINLDIVKQLWKHHTKKTMFLIKLAYGLTVPFIICAGLAKLSYRKFITSALTVTVIQYSLFMIIGFYLGESYEQGGTYIKYTYMLITLLIVIFAVFSSLFPRYARRVIFRMETEEATHKH